MEVLRSPLLIFVVDPVRIMGVAGVTLHVEFMGVVEFKLKLCLYPPSRRVGVDAAAQQIDSVASVLVLHLSEAIWIWQTPSLV